VLALEDESLAGDEGQEQSQVISSIASCRSTLPAPGPRARARRWCVARPKKLPDPRSASAIPLAAARKSGALEAKYISLEAGYGSRKVSIQFSNALRFPSSTRSSILRRL